MNLAITFVASLAGRIEEIYYLVRGQDGKKTVCRSCVLAEGVEIPRVWGQLSLQEPRTEAAFRMLEACGFPSSLCQDYADEIGRLVLGGMEGKTGWRMSARLFVIACYGVIDRRAKLPPLVRIKESKDISELWKEDE